MKAKEVTSMEEEKHPENTREKEAQEAHPLFSKLSREKKMRYAHRVNH